MKELYYETYNDVAIMFASIIVEEDLQEILGDAKFLILMNEYITSFDTVKIILYTTLYCFVCFIVNFINLNPLNIESELIKMKFLPEYQIINICQFISTDISEFVTSLSSK